MQIKKSTICLVLLFFFFFYWKAQALNNEFMSNLRERTVTAREPIIFSDSNFSQPERDFSAGQSIYIKIIHSGSGSKEKKARLLDWQKSQVLIAELARQGETFTAVLTAPNAQGVYYLDIKIDDGSSVYASQQNINVGGVKGESVSSSAESKVVVNSGEKVMVTEKTQITPTIASASIALEPTVLPESEVTPIEKVQAKTDYFLERITFFFKKIFKNLTRIFK